MGNRNSAGAINASKTLDDLVAYPEAALKVLTGKSDELEYRARTRSETFVMSIVHPDPVTRREMEISLQKYALLHLRKVDNFKVYSYTSSDEFLQESEQKKRLYHSIFIPADSLNETITKKIISLNEGLAPTEENKFNIFTENDLEKALKDAISAQYSRRTRLKAIIVTGKEKRKFGYRGVELLNQATIRRGTTRMFDAVYLTKSQVHNILKKDQALPADIIIYDLSKETPNHYWNVGLLKKLIAKNPNCFVISPVTPGVHKAMTSDRGRFHYLFMEMQRETPNEIELFRVYRPNFQDWETLDTDGIDDFFGSLRTEYIKDIVRYWSYITGLRISGLPAPRTGGKGILDQQITELSEKMPNRIEKDVPLGALSTMGMGGIGKCVAYPASLEDLKRVIEFSTENELSYYVTGKFSNTIAGNVPGVLISTTYMKNILNVQFGNKSSDIRADTRNARSAIENLLDQVATDEEIYLEVEAGVPLPEIASLASYLGLSGSEFLIRIPGNAGGGAVMNTGVGFTGIERIINGVKVIKPNGELDYIPHDQLRFDYRYSELQNYNYVVYSVIFKLKKGDRENINKLTQKFIAQRGNEPKLSAFPSVGSIILRRGYVGAEQAVYSSTDDFLEPEALGIKSEEGNVFVPERPAYSSWVVTEPSMRIKARGLSKKISSASIYELAQVLYRVGQVAQQKREITLHYEAKFLGVDKSGEPLHKVMQEVLAGIRTPDQVRKQLEIGGKYLKR